MLVKITMITLALMSFFPITTSASILYNKDSNKLDIYGKFTARHYFSDYSSQDGDQTYARLGIRGETQITPEMIGFGQWEHQFAANNPESAGTSADKTRLAFAGLKFTKWGSIDYGRNFGVNYSIGSWTDLTPDIVSDTSGHVDVFMTHRTSGVATYRNSDFYGLIEGLSFIVQYQGKSNESAIRTPSKTHGDGVGGSISYEHTDFSIGFSYAKSNRTNGQVNAGKEHPNYYAQGEIAEVWNSAIKYDNRNIYLAMVYAETRNVTPFGSPGYIADKTKNFETIALYRLSNGFTPSVAYRESKANDLNSVWGDKYLVRYVDIATAYNFNKNFTLFVEYKINLLDSNDFYSETRINTDNVFATGLIYRF